MHMLMVVTDADSNDNNEQSTFSGYGFTVPSGATSIEVRVRLDAWASNGMVTIG